MHQQPTHVISPLGERTCLDRLQQAQFGRVAISADALPVIVPIQYALLGSDPVFCADPGTTLMSASDGRVLCLEVGEIDPVLHTGWSVLVTGRADLLTEPEDLRAATALNLGPWIGSGSAFIRIAAALISGRSIDHHPARA